MGTIFAAVIVLSAIVFTFRIWSKGREPRDIWAISIYHGSDLMHLSPHPAHDKRPAVLASDVTDVRARFVADPFLIRQGAEWWMFFEVYNEGTKRGEIALASSRDGIAWKYDRVVLREPFHVSYPYVFEHGGSYFMVPETGRAGAVRLYEAASFPYEWHYRCNLLQGSYVDPSIVRWEGLWWLFVRGPVGLLEIHFANQPAGPWTQHPSSPVVGGGADYSRPGGRIVNVGGRLIRFAQDGERSYGHSLRAFEIVALTTRHYEERDWAPGRFLEATGTGWSADGMHHIDAQQNTADNWVAAVDGKRCVMHFNWRRGLRSALRVGRLRREEDVA